MKKLFLIVFCITPLFLLGKDKGMQLRMPDFQFSTGNNGYYVSPVYFGGNIAYFPDKDGFHSILNPILGFRVTRRLHLGVSAGIQYGVQEIDVPTGFQVTEKYKYKEAFYDVSLFSRYFIYYRFFLHTEPGVINIKQLQVAPYWNPQENKIVEHAERINIPSVLGGLGYAQPIGRQSILVVTVLYDFYQHENSPYGKYPFIRGGFNLGF